MDEMRDCKELPAKVSAPRTSPIVPTKNSTSESYEEVRQFRPLEMLS